MGLIDVSELMDDTDFVQPLTLVSRSEKVNNYGKAILTETPKETHGSVQSISGKTLQRLPEALQVANLQEFWLREAIVTGGPGCKYPDIIIKNGTRFAVQSVFDWSDWGGGWSQGTCIAERPSG